MRLEDDRQVESLFTPELERELWDHAGKWVAIVDQRVIAVADTLPALIRKARDVGHTEPLIHRVPDKGTSYFF